MKYIILLMLTVGALLPATGQTRFEGEIIDAENNQLLLCEHFGEKVRVMDTLQLDEENRFLYHLAPAAPNGLYRLYISENKWLEFILGYNNVSFQTTAQSPMETLDIGTSWQNKRLYEYLGMLEANAEKKEALKQFVEEYPETDRLMKLSEKALENMYKQEQGFLEDLRDKHPDAFVTRYLNFLFSKPKAYYLNDSKELRREVISQKDWSNTVLLNSDAYSRSLINYLMLYADPDAGREKLSMNYRQAIDSIFSFIPEGSPVYDYAMLYLLEGFEQFEMESLIMHMIKNYSDKCSQTQGKLENRITYYQKFHNGAKAPDFICTDMTGEPVQFYEHVSGKTLLIFWATWCGHCKQMNQKLKQLYPDLNQAGVEIVSISLDDQPDELKTYMEQTNLPWPVWCDYQGWESPVAETYSLYATPTMLLIDDEKTILGKPLNVNQLIYMIKDIQ
jgi:peroxiredoxin